MLRPLVVLLVVAGAAWYLWGGSTGAGAPSSPEAQYAREAARAKDMEKQLQDQAAGQLRTLDGQSQ